MVFRKLPRYITCLMSFIFLCDPHEDELAPKNLFFLRFDFSNTTLKNLLKLGGADAVIRGLTYSIYLL